jgi:hypothetical protein
MLNRMYADFLMPARLDQFQSLLESALDAGYQILSVERFWRLIQDGVVDAGAHRYLILRHDVDTDPATAAAIFRIEQTLGIDASYYFRMATVDFDLMGAIGQSGSQASYHYEDLATVVKRRRLRSRDAVQGGFIEARDRFQRNLTGLRDRTGLPMRVVASHGDFVNRKIRIPNWALLIDRQFRLEVGVDLEAYDDEFMQHVSSRHTDTGHPAYWLPEPPLAAIERREPVVYLLTHPRHWRVNRGVNIRDDLRRVEEGLRYSLTPHGVPLISRTRQSVRPPRALTASPPAESGRDVPMEVEASRFAGPPSVVPSEAPVLVIRASAERLAERKYILDVVLSDWLGIGYELRAQDGPTTAIQLAGDPGTRELTLPDILFATPDEQWLKEPSMPSQPFARLDSSEVPLGDPDLPGNLAALGPLPVLYGVPGATGAWRETATGLALNVDVFGTIFFLLTRYEEIVRRLEDEHERFPAYASMASMEGYLERPLADEYLELLWAALHTVWPELTRRRPRFRLRLTHDVDQPWAALGQTLPVVARSVGADLFERADPLLAAERSWALLASRAGRISHDPFDNFDFLMSTSERFGLKSTFYFLSGGTGANLDGRYLIGDPPIVELLRRIASRGHEIGLHASYASFQDPDQTQKEFDALRAACRGAGIEQDRWGVRQHFLRFMNPQTWRNQDQAGFDYDSTLGFADHVGFRAGTSREFQVFDLLDRRALQLRERPLIVMDASLFGYMGLSPDQALARTKRIIDASRQHGGEAVICYHNSTLPGARERAYYLRLVAELVGKESRNE